MTTYLLICLMLWQSTVAFIKAGIITYQEKNTAQGVDKGQRNSYPIIFLFVLQMFARVISVL